MKQKPNSVFSMTIVPALAAALFLSAGKSLADTPAQIYSFGNNPDGAGPAATLFQASDGFLYGTAGGGGATANGTVFRISPAGAFHLVYSFTNGTDGQHPAASLVQGRDGNLYGTTTFGGSNCFGTVFRLTPGGAITPVYSFSAGTDGAIPMAGLVLGKDGNLYGTTFGGNTPSKGSVYRISTNGVFTSLHAFTGGADGGKPQAPLIQAADGNLYGTTSQGGATSNGTIFRITPAGALTVIYSFTNGTDGAAPQAGLVQGGDGYFYGAAKNGGGNSLGTIFRVSTNGAFTTLHTFSPAPEGFGVLSSLVQFSDGKLYGAAESGGAGSAGSIFRISTAGVFEQLYSFSKAGGDGQTPVGGLIQANDGNLYGTTTAGGTNLYGTIFRYGSASPVNGPLVLTTPVTQGLNFTFTFQTVSNQSYTILQNTNLATTNWTVVTNLTGDGSVFHFSTPRGAQAGRFFRVSQP
jgi:uncharacterized repeat protein (TIGR03803 family)